MKRNSIFSSRNVGKVKSNLFLPSPEKGFTLIEIVVAVIILGLAYVTVLQNFSVSMKNIIKLDLNKSEVFENILEFEEFLQLVDDEEIEVDNLPSFLEWRMYRLVVITDEDGEFMTLKIKRL